MPRFRNRYLLFIGGASFTAMPLVLFALHFESWQFGPVYRATAVAFLLVAVPVNLVILLAFGLYRRLWRFASIRDMEHILAAGMVSSVCTLAIGRWALVAFGLAPAPVPFAVLLPYIALSLGTVALPRLALRMRGMRALLRRGSAGVKKVLVVGAGAAGEMIVRELARNESLGMIPVAFVDDDPTKLGNTLAGLKICGTLRDIPTVARRLEVQEILIAMPTAPGPVIRAVIKAAQEVGVPTRIVPGLGDILSNRVSVSSIRPVRIDDLLRREPVETDLAALASIVGQRTVMVTGAGGSIGSELCRQLLAFHPATLILVGHSENPIFDIQNELAGIAGASGITTIVPVIADVRMKSRVQEIFTRHRPDAVFHAAAHKHVPLMEQNPAEAITNNILGTRNIVQACLEFETPRFVMISTDKAVRPTNVMGASKRVAEHVVANAARRRAGNFVSVRFGNVLGSQGSVVPTFTRQIREGGPLTVTHPEMRRYFMTIPEAVELVLQAGVQGEGGELFMLNMGEPVKILDLARDMIRLSGLREDVDIEIKYSGVRPGEKLYEEMFLDHEVVEKTEHPKILRVRTGALEHVGDADVERIIELAQCPETTAAQIRAELQRLVPDYAPEACGAISADPESMYEPPVEDWEAVHGSVLVPTVARAEAPEAA